MFTTQIFKRSQGRELSLKRHLGQKLSGRFDFTKILYKNDSNWWKCINKTEIYKDKKRWLEGKNKPN